ncbi:hypothetical protein PV328_011047 [Microctonus aethiopoides]|uniref:Uncharacterized protein n=1 Tax=Microctonus aethiopoides TaxID=144406 RepID=A0AA39EUX0_9HYME|nr:hypothetical protein PV328_011047 [Microctonus aethiopoides]
MVADLFVMSMCCCLVLALQLEVLVPVDVVYWESSSEVYFWCGFLRLGGSLDFRRVGFCLCGPPRHLQLRRKDRFEIEIDGDICIRKMEKIREERKKEREAGEKLSKELGNIAWAGNFYFDYCGIRWMTEGRWGMDHPSGDPTGLIWSRPGEIYNYYD